MRLVYNRSRRSDDLFIATTITTTSIAIATMGSPPRDRQVGIASWWQSKAMQQISQLYWLGQEPENSDLSELRGGKQFLFLFFFCFCFCLSYFILWFCFFGFCCCSCPEVPTVESQQAENGQGPKGDNINAAANGCQWSNAGHSGTKKMYIKL